jgi:hypothetical protein
MPVRITREHERRPRTRRCRHSESYRLRRRALSERGWSIRLTTHCTRRHIATTCTTTATIYLEAHDALGRRRNQPQQQLSEPEHGRHQIVRPAIDCVGYDGRGRRVPPRCRWRAGLAQIPALPRVRTRHAGRQCTCVARLERNDPPQPAHARRLTPCNACEA